MKVIIGKSQSDTLVIGETYSYSDSTNIFDGTEVSYILAYFSRNKMPNPNLIELRKESRETEKGEEITDDIKEQVYQFIRDNGINKVICFGRPAFAALFNSIARGQLISKLANKMLSECSEVPGVKASVIEYPYGYLLKEPDDIESYISGIGDVFRKSQPFEITNQEVTEDELIRWLEETDSGNYSRIGMDYETNAENQFSYKFKTTIIGFSRLAAPSIMLGSTVKAEGIWYRVPDSGLSDKLWDVLKNFLDNNYQKIWAYNCPFEIKVSKRLFGEFYEFQDTMVLMTMFDKRGSLKNVARSELGVSFWDTTVKQFLDLAETIFKKYDKKKSLTLEEKIELVKEDTEINSLISEIYWDNDEFIRLLEANWGSPWGSVPRDVLGPYCADDASYTIILAEQNDKDWMKQAYDFHIPNAYLDALFEINGTTWDETEADYQINDLTKKAIKCLSSLILLMPRLQEFHEEPIRLKVNNILSKQLPYENVYYTPKQKKEKRVLITDELGRLGDLVAIFNPNSNTNDNRALFWDTYFTDELKKATFLELVLEEMQLKQKRHEMHEKIFDMTEFKKGVKPSEIINRISAYLKEHKDEPFAKELSAAGNKAKDNLPEFSNKFASDVIKLQYKVHVTYFGLDISDESTWSNEFKMLYYIFLYKKYMKVISANINGAAGRALVSEDLGRDKFGNIIRGDNVMDISDKTGKKFILDFEFNPMSAASLRWTSSAHCLTGDTRVKLTGGEVDTVEDIFERIKAGETLKSYSVNEETLEMHEQEIKDVVLNAYTDELIELELDNGDIIRCTPNHRFMLANGKYIEAKDLEDYHELAEENMFKDYVIYKVINDVNGKSYIGRTLDIGQRVEDHFSVNSRFGNKELQEAVSVFSKEKLRVEILESKKTTETVINALETKLILEHNTLVPNGYNKRVSRGFWSNKSGFPKGPGDTDASEQIYKNWQNKETREKLCLERRNRWNNKEYKERIRKATYDNPDWQEKVSKGNRKYFADLKNKNAIQERFDKVKKSLNTPESFERRRQIQQKYEERDIAIIKHIFNSFLYRGCIQDVFSCLAGTSHEVSYRTLLDIARNRYYSQVLAKEFDIPKYVETDKNTNRICKINLEVFNED